MKNIKLGDIVETENINNRIQITTIKDEIYTLEPKRLKTRVEAQLLAKKLTAEALKKDDAFHKLGGFKNNYRSMRNYEIEEYIQKLSSDPTYRIVEKCPYNGFSWFN